MDVNVLTQSHSSLVFLRSRLTDRRLEEADIKRCFLDPKRCPNFNFPPLALSRLNQAMDVVEVTKWAQSMHPNTKLYYYGQSFGSMIAHDVLAILPNTVSEDYKIMYLSYLNIYTNLQFFSLIMSFWKGIQGIS